MLFDLITDEKKVYLYDENQNVLNVYKSVSECEKFLSSLESSVCAGLRYEEKVIKWYDSNYQLAKLLFIVFFLIFCIYYSL